MYWVLFLYWQKKYRIGRTTSGDITGIFQKIGSCQHLGFKGFGSLCYSYYPTLTHKQQCHMSYLMCQCHISLVSLHVTCQMTCVICPLDFFFNIFFYKDLELVGGGSVIDWASLSSFFSYPCRHNQRFFLFLFSCRRTSNNET